MVSGYEIVSFLVILYGKLKEWIYSLEDMFGWYFLV